MNTMLADIHIKRTELEKKPGYVKEVLQHGDERAKVIAEKNMQEIKEVMNLL